MKTLCRILVMFAVSSMLILIWQYSENKIASVKSKSITINVTAKPMEQRLILAWNEFFVMPLWFWGKRNKGKTMVKEKCDKYECMFTMDKSMLNESSMILVHLAAGIPPLPPYRIPNQPWVFFILEPPIHTHCTGFKHLHKVFNLSISYRTDSDVYFGYGWMTKRTEKDGQLSPVPEIAQGRTKLIVWFVSNCHAKERKAYVEELGKYVPIDIHGRCMGQKDPCNYKKNCTIQFKRKYKFCIAFENSRCRDYISEKYWRSVRAGCVPLVMGNGIEFYNKVVPPDSFIHVDNFTSPKELASYIEYLDQNDEAYYRYHMWRHKYNAYERDNEENIISLCDFCSVLDVKPQHGPYDLKQFWGRSQNCNESKRYKYE